MKLTIQMGRRSSRRRAGLRLRRHYHLGFAVWCLCYVRCVSLESTLFLILCRSRSSSPCSVCNKQLKLIPKLMPRFLVVELCKDQAEQYNSVMNSIFAAQGLGIPIDCCVLAQDQSTMLQQAAYLTGGVYITPITSGRCLQQMMMHCLPSTETRSLLKSMVPVRWLFNVRCRKVFEHSTNRAAMSADGSGFPGFVFVSPAAD